jgi:2-keto-4-pentenoate hydratase/2-oxohepta-3-ene-1,7-dioic acid hydratase in catechol pathway
MGAAIVGKLYPFEKYINEKSIAFTLYVNDDLKQIGHSQNMIFNFMDICQYIHSFSPLRAADLIFTGTPEGVGEIKRGDKFKLKLAYEAEELGIL